MSAPATARTRSAHGAERRVRRALARYDTASAIAAAVPALPTSALPAEPIALRRGASPRRGVLSR
jgi:hypothetical protein